MAKLWQKKNTHTLPEVHAFITSPNLAADRALLPFDIVASKAHAAMLGKVGLIKKRESAALLKALTEAEALCARGAFKFSKSDEDCHTALENFLVHKLGDIGKKIHTGRSRNDQVLVAVRLYTKHELVKIKAAILALAGTIVSFAEKHEWIPMPGYTHTQQAMPSSVGQWAGAFVESLLDDYSLICTADELNDQNPLGSGAGFGTTLPLDRAFTTKLLGFKRVQSNALYCQNSRGKIESAVLSSLVQVGLTLNKIANDVLWFTSKEFSFFTVSPTLTTGSSMMPQKRNLDIMEVVRANVVILMACQSQLQIVNHNLLSGYHKDLKVTKQPLFDGLRLVEESCAITKLLFKHLTPNKEKLRMSLSPEIFATDSANELVMKGTSFRDAYRRVGDAIEHVQLADIEKNLRSKRHIGAPGNLELEALRKRLKSF